jgi:hypothetical protein
VCDTPPTPEEEAKADEIIADVEELLDTTYPNVSAALADGYRYAAPPFGGEGSHLVNDDYGQDGLQVDDPSAYAEAVTKPESLVVDNNGVNIAAAMYVREYVGPGPSWPPAPVGCIGTWHAHDNLCYDAPFLEGGSVTTIAWSGCPSGSRVLITPEMLHVWHSDYWNGDPFQGIET